MLSSFQLLSLYCVQGGVITLDLHHKIVRSASLVLCSICLRSQSSGRRGHSSLFSCYSISETVAMSVDSFVECLCAHIILVELSSLAWRTVYQSLVWVSCFMLLWFRSLPKLWRSSSSWSFKVLFLYIRLWQSSFRWERDWQKEQWFSNLSYSR